MVEFDYDEFLSELQRTQSLSSYQEPTYVVARSIEDAQAQPLG